MSSKALKSILNHFKQKNGELIINGKTISQILTNYQTPLYIYDKSKIEERHQLLRQHIPDDINIYYAVKANPNVEILKEINKYYDGVDIASMGEMKFALDAGIKSEQMSFAGPGKSFDELAFAIQHDIGTISVEGEGELNHIIKISKQQNKQARVLLRVNPAFDLSKSGMKMGGGPKQFGIDSEEIPRVIQTIINQKAISFKGIHIFAGSQNLDYNSILEAFQKILEYAVFLRQETDTELEILNLGGGFGIPYFANDEELDIASLGVGIHELLKKYRSLLPNTQFKIELGRFIVAVSGIYVSKIRYRKISRDNVFLVIDGGMHHHLAASGNFGQSLVRRPFPVTVVNKLNNNTEKVNIVGPLCTPLDTFGWNVEIPKAEEGDFIAVMNSGAYGFSASPRGFLSHPEPGELVI